MKPKQQVLGWGNQNNKLKDAKKYPAQPRGTMAAVSVADFLSVFAMTSQLPSLYITT